MSSEPLLNKIYSETESIDEEIRKFETLINDEPRRIQEQMEAEKTLMPAPDDLEDRRRLKTFYSQISKGQRENVRRHQAKNTFLFILLAVATLSIAWWIYSALVGAGLL